MKRVRCVLIGSGVVDDPFRVKLPRYTMVDVDYAAKVAIVDVPDDCYPPAPEGKAETKTNDPKYGQVITKVDVAHAIDAAQFFDKKYREHIGEFGLDVK